MCSPCAKTEHRARIAHRAQPCMCAALSPLKSQFNSPSCSWGRGREESKEFHDHLKRVRRGRVQGFHRRLGSHGQTRELLRCEDLALSGRGALQQAAGDVRIQTTFQNRSSLLCQAIFATGSGRTFVALNLTATFQRIVAVVWEISIAH